MLIFTSVGFISDTETDTSIMKVVDENFRTVNLTVGLMGTICGEIEIDFRVSNSNRSFTATGMILRCTMLESA